MLAICRRKETHAPRRYARKADPGRPESDPAVTVDLSADVCGFARADDAGAGTNTDIYSSTGGYVGQDDGEPAGDTKPSYISTVVRFPAAGIPKDATINSATLTLKVATGPAGSKTVTARWYGNETISASDPADYTAYVALARTTATVSGDKTYTSTTGDYTHDVTAIVQELVQQTGWTTGAKIQLLGDFLSKTGTGFPALWTSVFSTTLTDHTLTIEYE